MMPSRQRSSGFTLVEVVIYVAIFSIFFTVIIGFFWNMKSAQLRATVYREVKENAAQVLQAFSYSVRNARDVDQGASVFGSDPGSVSLEYSGGNTVLDAYSKEVTIGGLLTTIRKARLTRGGASFDLTSDAVTVDQLRFLDLSQPGAPDTVAVDLTLSAVNPGNDPDYDLTFSARSGAVIRKTL
jgi:type II secretory pathway pseudopilin PulG